MSDETVRVPAALVEALREALDETCYADTNVRRHNALVTAVRAVVDAATPAASVPATDKVEELRKWRQAAYYNSDHEPRLWRAVDNLLAAVDADTPAAPTRPPRPPACEKCDALWTPGHVCDPAAPPEPRVATSLEEIPYGRWVAAFIAEEDEWVAFEFAGHATEPAFWEDDYFEKYVVVVLPDTPAAPVGEPLCKCGHRHPYEPGGTYASQGPACEKYWVDCSCKTFTPAPLSSPRRTRDEGTEDEAEAAAWLAHRTGYPNQHDVEIARAAFVAGFRAARLAGEDDR